MSVTLSQAPQKFNEVVEFLKKELSSMRAGRATPQLVEHIKADVYGQAMPIVQLANINVVDASLLTVKPWDPSSVDAVVQALKTADIGIQPILEGDVIKLPIPPLTEERRLEYVKVMKTKLEEAKIAVRQLRKEIIDAIEAEKLSEDETERAEKQLQKHVDEANEKIDAVGVEKERELMQV